LFLVRGFSIAPPNEVGDWALLRLLDTLLIFVDDIFFDSVGTLLVLLRLEPDAAVDVGWEAYFSHLR